MANDNQGDTFSKTVRPKFVTAWGKGRKPDYERAIGVEAFLRKIMDVRPVPTQSARRFT